MKLSGVRPSVCLSVCPFVCPIILPTHVAAASLLLWARRQEMQIDCGTARAQQQSVTS